MLYSLFSLFLYRSFTHKYIQTYFLLPRSLFIFIFLFCAHTHTNIHALTKHKRARARERAYDCKYTLSHLLSLPFTHKHNIQKCSHAKQPRLSNRAIEAEKFNYACIIRGMMLFIYAIVFYVIYCIHKILASLLKYYFYFSYYKNSQLSVDMRLSVDSVTF